MKKKRALAIVVSLTLILTACQSNKKESQESAAAETNTSSSIYQTTGEIERISDEIDKLIPKDAVIEVLDSGFTWSEGPVWIEEGGYLLFSDVPENKVYKWKEGDGKSVYLDPSGYTGELGRGGEEGSNGLLLDQDGSLILCQHGDRRVARMDAPLSDPKSAFQTLTDSYNGKRFNSPNDGDYNLDWELYFTDPPYGLEGGVDDPDKELSFQGVYKYTREGETILLIDTLSRPNGIAFSPDEETLYVANSDPKKAFWAAFSVDEGGMLSNGSVFFDATKWIDEKPGLPDGLKVDANGYIYATGPGGVLIFNPAGEHLGTVKTGQRTANCGYGDGYLYMTADYYLMRVKVNPQNW